MTPATQLPLVSTIGERCRVCYQCVRECPAKAIRIADHQAQVIPERCIGCGVCYQVCTQDAKKILSAVEAVESLLAGPIPVAAILAPSFPAEFIRYEYSQVVGALRQLGFAAVHEVAFGAELVAMQYQKLVAEDADRLWIATTCPSVCRIRPAVSPGTDVQPGANRVADDRDGEAPARAAGAGVAHRLHRTVHRQEA